VRPGALPLVWQIGRHVLEAEVTAADLLVLAPWLIFGAGLAAICYRLLARRCATRRHRRGGRWRVPGLGMGDSRVRHPRPARRRPAREPEL